MKNFLVIKTHAIGDVIMATPAFRALRNAYPHADISILIGKWSAPILKSNPSITRCMEFEDDILHKKRIIGLIKLILKLRLRKFDAAIIFHPSPFIHLLAVLAGIKKRFGLSRNGKNFFLTASVEENGSYNFYYPMNFLNVVNLLNTSDSERNKNSDAIIDVFSEEHDKLSLKNLLKNQGVNDFNNLILIAPAGSINPKENITARLWPYEYYIELIRLITSELPKFTIVLTGGYKDKVIVKEIKDQVPQALDLAGKTTLNELVCLVGLSQVIICNDSAVLHIGIAQKRPTIGIFGPTSIQSRVPKSQIEYSIQSSETCSPCYRFGEFLGCRKNASCMRAIVPEMVFNKVKTILGHRKV